MTDKELRKLRRDDLLQILINQQRQLDEQGAELGRLRAELEKRDIAISESGTLAEAAMRLNGVFDAAQSAADQYLEQAQKRADELAEQAQKSADEAARAADEVVRGARGEADRILREARAEAERLLAEAGQRPEPVAPVQETAADEGEGKRRFGLLRRNRKS